VVRDAARAVGVALLGIQEHEVDVGRNVQFAPAELAHADDDELAALPRRGCAARRASRRRAVRTTRARRRSRRRPTRSSSSQTSARSAAQSRSRAITRRHHAAAQTAQAPLDCGFVVAICIDERAVDFVARKRLPCCDLRRRAPDARRAASRRTAKARFFESDRAFTYRIDPIAGPRTLPFRKVSRI
jgi:hypothetical protein